MSDATVGTKSETPKTESANAAKTAEKATPEKSASEKSGDGESGGGAVEKSARESIGGAKEVHYGYFSNVKTPEYRAGWDSIWGNKKSTARKRPATAKPGVRKPLAPVRLALDIDELPAEITDGLVEVARARLKKSRINYDRRNDAGEVDWHIECWVKRV